MVFLVSIVFIKMILKNDNVIFIVELLIYCVFFIKMLWCSIWEKVKGFVCKVGIFIFGGLVVIWLLSYVGLYGINVNIN